MREHHPLQIAMLEQGRRRLEFAVAVGVDSVTLWRWCTGRSRPSSRAFFEAIARELDRPIEEVDAWFPQRERKPIQSEQVA